MMKNASAQNEKLSGVPVAYDPFSHGELIYTLPSTEAQREIWLAMQMDPEVTLAYNEAAILRIKGQLQIDILREAIQDLIKRHEALRITFTPDGETICVSASRMIAVPLVDISHENEEEQHLRSQGIQKHEVNQPFDIEHGPLIRAQVIKFGEEEYQLLITIHHLVWDGWSWSVIIDDLGALYSAKTKGLVPQLPEPVTIRDYVTLIENSEQALAAEEYWLAQYSDRILSLDMPTDRPRPSVRSYNSARLDWEFDPQLIADLKQLGAKAKCSFLTTLLVGFEVFLHRLSGQDELIVGILAARQAATGQFELVGHCVNLLPIRSHIDGDLSFNAYLKTRRPKILDDFEHQQVTFGSLMKKLDLRRDPSRIPLVPVVLNIDQSIKAEENQFEGLEVEVDEVPRDHDNFELFLNALEKAENVVVLQCQYNTDLHDGETIRSRLRAFEALLGGIVEDPDRKISALPIMSEGKRNKLLVEWNATEANFPREKCIHELFEEQVASRPDKIAVIYEDQQLTYGELNQRANQLANHLISLDVAPGDLVGVFLERSPEIVVALLAVLKAGAVYLPLDVAFPQERNTTILDDSGAGLLLTKQSLKPLLPQFHGRVVNIDSDGPELISLCETGSITCRSSPNDLAYVMYTSGSTGKPKGVQVSHRAVVNFLHSVGQEPGFTPDDHMLAVTTISFDIAGLELFLPLSLGGITEIVSEETSADGFLLVEKLKSTKATFMQATPSRWQMLLDAGWEGAQQLMILSGGESLPLDLAHQLLDCGTQVWNFYGPTETTIYSTVKQVLPGAESVTIGRPIANTQIYILDRYGNITPIGIPGELYIGGEGLANGYLDQPNLTREKFVHNPFVDSTDALMYKTGDIARYRLDGELEFLGRSDHQVKVRGFRIELGEIENALLSHDAVHQAVVTTCTTEPGEGAAYLENRLVAYLILHQGYRMEVGELRTHVGNVLPEYMIPEFYIELAEIPLTPNGKIDRRALPAPDHSRPELEEGLVAPRNAIEKEISEIWAEVLKLEQIGVMDNFFDLGGHSLLATRVTSRMGKAFDIVLPLRVFFQNPTVEKLGQVVEAHRYVRETEFDSSDEGDGETIVI